MLHPVIKLAQQLIACESITPQDAGCQQIIANELAEANFKYHPLPFENVTNLWATHGQGTPTLVLLGHTDVVPPGPLADWQSPPFSPEIRENKLYGRGAADMKGNLAAMIIAAKNFIKANPHHPGTLAFLITSDEEGAAEHGTKRVINYLQKQGQLFNYCIVGEASAEKKLGDTIKIGRRGSLNGKLMIEGKQGHIAYPHRAQNAIHLCIPLLQQLVMEKWDEGTDYFSPTNFQISNIHAGVGAANVIPGQIEITFNFRYSPQYTAETLKQKTEQIIQNNHFQYKLEWQPASHPFLTLPESRLIQVTETVIEEAFGKKPTLSTTGGTSDGRYIAPTGCEVIELGVCNQTIHQVNEHAEIAELEKLSTVYQEILHRLLR